MYVIYYNSKVGDPQCFGSYESKEEAIRDLCKYLQVVREECGQYYDRSKLPYIPSKGYLIDKDEDAETYENEQSFVDRLLKESWPSYTWDIHVFTIMELEKLNPNKKQKILK